jgi:hypothetical protein
LLLPVPLFFERAEVSPYFARSALILRWLLPKPQFCLKSPIISQIRYLTHRRPRLP